MCKRREKGNRIKYLFSFNFVPFVFPNCFDARFPFTSVVYYLTMPSNICLTNDKLYSKTMGNGNENRAAISKAKSFSDL